MKKFLMFLVFLLLVFGTTIWFLHTPQRKQLLTDVHVEVQGLDREYLVYSNAQKDKPAPLVVVLHGGGGPLGSAELMAERSGWKEKAEKEKFVVVFMQGTLENPNKPLNLTLGDPNRNIRLWHVGKNIPPITHDGVDDVAYIRTALAGIESTYAIDPTRIFVTGFSNGATMSYRLGVELSDVVAAIAPVAGLLYSNTAPTLPVSLLHIIGTSDTVPTSTPQQGIFSARDAVSTWAQFTHCVGSAQTTEEQGARVQIFTSCERGMEVKGIYIQGLVHAYPGRASLFGISSTDTFNATDLAWNFFKQHPKVRQ